MDTSILSVPNKGAFMSYPVSTLSPKIVPHDLTNFKTRGIGVVQRELEQKLVEMREEYIRVIDQFNWNKLIYESEINFEPTVGQVYHLYHIRSKYVLSMIAPEDWVHEELGSFRLNVDKQWDVVRLNPSVDREKLFGFVS